MLCGAGLAQDIDEEKPRELIITTMPTAPKSAGGVEARLSRLDLAQPLGSVLDELAGQAKLKVQPNWVELAKAGVERSRQVGNTTLVGVTAQTALDVICRLADPAGWTEAKDVIVVTSKTDLASRQVTRDYHAGSLKAGDVPALLQALLGLKGVTAVEKGEQIAVTASLSDHPQIERVLTLAWRGSTAEDWLHILGGARFRFSREAEFGWDKADLRQVLADLSLRGGTSVVLDEPALQTAKFTPPPVTLKSERMTPDKALAAVLAQGGASATLTPEVMGRGEMILVTTRQHARPLLAAFLVHRPLLTKQKMEDPQALMAFIRKTVDPTSWHEDRQTPPPTAGKGRPAPALAAVRTGEGRMALAGNRLICSQSAKTLAAIGELMEDPACRAVNKRLAAAAARTTPPKPSTIRPPMMPPVRQPTGPSIHQPTTPPVRQPTTPPVRQPTTPSGKNAAAGKKTEPTTPVVHAPAAPAEEPQVRRLKLAEVYLQQGLNDKAAEILREIIDKYPQSEEAAKAKKKLDALKEE